MPSPAHENYLATEVLTATPQKLQLLLIEAAMRCAARGRQKWREGDDEQACEALIRAQEIVSQVLAGMDHEANAAVVKKVAAVYLFVFRRLMEANLERSEAKLDDALRVLEIERGTWRELCEKLGAQGHAGDAFTAGIDAAHAEVRRAARPPAAPVAAEIADDLPAAGFSLEA